MIYIALAFITGFLVKLTDDIIEHKRKFLFKDSEILFGALYGMLIGVMISNFPAIAPLWIGVTSGVLLAGKIDHRAHFMGIFFIILASLVLGVGSVSWALIAIFSLVSFGEEKLNDIADKVRNNNVFFRLLRLRPLVEISCLATSIYLGKPDIFIAILCFDIGYYLARKGSDL